MFIEYYTQKKALCVHNHIFASEIFCYTKLYTEISLFLYVLCFFMFICNVCSMCCFISPRLCLCVVSDCKNMEYIDHFFFFFIPRVSLFLYFCFVLCQSVSVNVLHVNRSATLQNYIIIPLLMNVQPICLD